MSLDLNLNTFLVPKKKKKKRKTEAYVSEVVNQKVLKKKQNKSTDLAASSRLVVSRTTSGAGVIKSPTTWPLVLLSNFCTSLKVCKIKDHSIGHVKVNNKYKRVLLEPVAVN